MRNQWNVNIVGSQDGYFKPESVRRCLNAFMPAERKSSPLRGIAKAGDLHARLPSGASRCVYMGVGGTYDVFTGHVKRAPKSGKRWGWSGSTACFRSRAA